MAKENLRVLQLNVWMGKVEGALKRFLENEDYDIICLQEVMASKDCEQHLSRLCFDLSRIMDAARMPYCFFSPNSRSKIGKGHFELGNAILSRIPFKKTEAVFVNGKYQKNFIFGRKPRNNLNIQAVELKNGLVVINHQGFWRPQPMGDENSVKCFAKVAEFVKKFNDKPLLMCGDLNIIHEAPAMRSLDFLNDLTSLNNIDNTLSGLGHNGKVACDHILVNDMIKVKNFRVLPDVVSDHLALELSFLPTDFFGE